MKAGNFFEAKNGIAQTAMPFFLRGAVALRIIYAKYGIY